MSPVRNHPCVERGGARRVVVEIARDDPRPAHQKLARRDAVMRQAAALGVDDLHLDAVHRPALHRLDGDLLRDRQVAMLALHRADGADRAHLGHAPAMHDRDAVFRLEGLDHGVGRGRAADEEALEARRLPAARLHLLQHAEPHRRDAERQADALGLEQLAQARPIQAEPGKTSFAPTIVAA